jgi:hypothetical protein
VSDGCYSDVRKSILYNSWGWLTIQGIHDPQKESAEREGQRNNEYQQDDG